jgi:hypothetical protein
VKEPSLMGYASGPIAFTLGIAAFLVPQVALLVTTPQSPVIEDPGWFLNSAANVGTISSVIAIVAALLAVRQRWRIIDTVMFGSGVLLAMASTLFTIGPGNIFPIVIVVGAVVIGAVILVGTLAGYVIQLASVRVGLTHR